MLKATEIRRRLQEKIDKKQVEYMKAKTRLLEMSDAKLERWFFKEFCIAITKVVGIPILIVVASLLIGKYCL